MPPRGIGAAKTSREVRSDGELSTRLPRWRDARQPRRDRQGHEGLDRLVRRPGDKLVDGGNPVSQVRTIASNGSVSNGGTNPSTGYSIIKADSLDAAVALAKGCPVLGGGASVEVAEVFAVM